MGSIQKIVTFDSEKCYLCPGDSHQGLMTSTRLWSRRKASVCIYTWPLVLEGRTGVCMLEERKAGVPNLADALSIASVFTRV